MAGVSAAVKVTVVDASPPSMLRRPRHSQLLYVPIGDGYGSSRLRQVKAVILPRTHYKLPHKTQGAAAVPVV